MWHFYSVGWLELQSSQCCWLSCKVVFCWPLGSLWLNSSWGNCSPRSERLLMSSSRHGAAFTQASQWCAGQCWWRRLCHYSLDVDMVSECVLGNDYTTYNNNNS